MITKKVKFIRFIFSLVFLGIISHGCFFGTFQTAETLGAGNVGSGAYVVVPTYTSKADRDSAFESGEFLENISGGGFFQIGATDNFDVGLCFSTAGIGAQGKLRFTPSRRISSSRGRSRRGHSSSHFDMATIITINYDFYRGGLLPKFDLLGSMRFNEYFALYGGGQVFYVPDLSDTYLDTEWNKELYLGINVKRGEESTPGMEWIPSSLYIEFGFPLDLERRAIMFGIGIGGADLPFLFGSCLGAMGD